MPQVDPFPQLENHRIRLEVRIARQSIIRDCLWIAIALLLNLILVDAFGAIHVPALLLGLAAFFLIIAINVLQGCTTYIYSNPFQARKTTADRR